MMWPNSFSGRGLARSTCSGRRLSLLVSTTHTFSRVELGCTSSGRSIGVARQVGGEARVDDDVGLGVESVGGRERALPEHEGQPRRAAVLLVACDRQRALGEEAPVMGASPGRYCSLDTNLDVLEGRIVAGIDDDAAVLVEDQLGALVAEASERGVLDGRGRRIEGVDLDDPAEGLGSLGSLSTLKRPRARPSCTSLPGRHSGRTRVCAPPRPLVLRLPVASVWSVQK